ncbi:MAG: hypothetical protein D6769_02075 [Methanobacteriota archaeon]|nr:MAG: hypothetical protein D6769_02075 [Euryarchaeota archaeon]
MGGHFLLTLPKFTSYDIAEVGWGSDFWYRSENFYPLNSEWAVGAVADGIAGIGPSVKFNVTIRDFGGEFMLTPAYNTNSGKFGGFAIFRASYSK